VSRHEENGRTVEELTCIVCPSSCEILVERDSQTGEILSIEHAQCRRGIAWVTRELLDPVRTVCSSVRVVGGTEPLASVKTDRPVRRDEMKAVVEALKAAIRTAPVSIGESFPLEGYGADLRIIVTRAVAAVGHADN
jgi:CxxC motif-containing protein